MRAVLAVFLVLIIGFSTFSQEVIKEKVEITPKSTKNNNLRSVASSNFIGSLRIQSDWVSDQWSYTYSDGTTYSTMCRVKFLIYSPCDGYTQPIETDWDYVGNMVYNLEPVTATSYQIVPSVFMRDLGDPNLWVGVNTALQFKVFVDGEEYLTANRVIVLSPWFGDINFTITSPEIDFGDWTPFQGQRKTNPMCGVIGNIKKDFITYTIEQGSQYVSFYNYWTNQNLGNSYVDNKDDPFGIELRYYNQYYGNEDYTVVVKADVHGYSKTSTFKIKAKKYTCSDAPQCNNPPGPIQLLFKDNPRGTFGIDNCNVVKKDVIQLGGFLPVINPHQMLNMGDPAPCYNSSTDNWQFTIPPVEINVILDLCTDNLRDYKVINSLDDLSPGEYCNALEDIKKHHKYPLEVSKGGYVFKPVLLKHEEVHKDFYESYLNRHKHKIDSLIQSYKLKCEDVISFDDAKLKGS